ncbi:hypothetical protein CMUS01_02460 [Colletotrichum musicola]|uniref:Uncharacterized protein n=1 Tax=Colletotrichum musicola TaxID=2175873 RepID=A0A8H6U727_9PEZI|nr:hypothetical protein CMUS01_02460 [Colletotrichum musicola]
MSKGTFASNVDFDAHLAEREALLVPTPDRSGNNNGPGRLPLPFGSRRNTRATPLPPVKVPNNRVSKRGPRQQGALNTQSTPKIIVHNPSDLQHGRPLTSRYYEDVEETFISEDATREIGLEPLIWRPGPKISFVYNGKYHTSQSYTTVMVNVCGLFLPCNFAILPKGFAEFEKIELLVGSKLRKKLDPAPKKIRTFLDKTFVQQPSKSLSSSTSSKNMRRGLVPKTVSEPARPPPQGFLQPAGIARSYGASYTMSGGASYHSSNDIGLISTPLTSICESGPAAATQGLNEEKNAVVRNDYESVPVACATLLPQPRNIDGYHPPTVDLTSTTPYQVPVPSTLQVPSQVHRRRRSVPASAARPIVSPVFDTMSVASTPLSCNGMGEAWPSMNYEYPVNWQAPNMYQVASTSQQDTPELRLPDQGSTSDNVEYIDPRLFHYGPSLTSTIHLSNGLKGWRDANGAWLYEKKPARAKPAFETVWEVNIPLSSGARDLAAIGQRTG